jgi:predicted Zn-dependent protease
MTMQPNQNHGRAAGLALVLAALSACATDRQVIAQANDANAEIAPATIQDPRLSSYIQSIGQRIIAAAQAADQAHEGPKAHFVKKEDNEWMFTDEKFHLVNSKTLNAFTTGGQHMYIYSELMEQCRSEDELAAVMAHEYAHVYSRHVHKGINRQYTMLAASAGAGLVGLAVGGKEHGQEYGQTAMVSTATIGQVLNLGYTREDEAEADKWGFYFYTHAGWDPNRFGDFFQQLIDKGLDTTPEAMSDHPSLASRVADAKERASKLPPEAASWRRPPVADSGNFAALKTRVAQVGSTMKTSEQLAAAQTLLSAVPSCVTPEDQPDQKAAQQRLVRALEGGAPRQAAARP